MKKKRSRFTDAEGRSWVLREKGSRRKHELVGENAHRLDCGAVFTGVFTPSATGSLT